MESTFKNMDCIAGMKEYPDKYFNLAIVDPVYGDVTKGGYMNANTKGLYVGTGKAAQKGYHNGLCDNLYASINRRNRTRLLCVRNRFRMFGG